MRHDVQSSKPNIQGYPGKVAGATQIDAFQMIKAFCKPRIKVGTEWVIKGQV